MRQQSYQVTGPNGLTLSCTKEEVGFFKKQGYTVKTNSPRTKRKDFEKPGKVYSCLVQ